MKPLTNEQKLFLIALSEYIDKHGFAPTVTEMSAMLGYQTRSMPTYHIHNLRDFGILTVLPQVHRGVAITNLGRSIIAEIYAEDENNKT